MSNVLLVEPDYRAKFPPLGLMKISTYHKNRGDCVTFVRGRDPEMREMHWHRIYISSLFTWELPRTVKTINYYQSSVSSSKDIYVGGIGATLLPDYIRQNAPCTVIEGPLDKPSMLGRQKTLISECVPDYDLLTSVSYDYKPTDAYFTRVTTGCVRKCAFCAVPRLEPTFGYCSPLTKQVSAVNHKYGEKQHLVILDNNILAIDKFRHVVEEIQSLGFTPRAKRNRCLRSVDFNQGIDARYIDDSVAKLLAQICLDPVRLAFDTDAMEKPYRTAIRCMAREGFVEFTNYMLYNFSDNPKSLYHRMCVNMDLSKELGVRVTGFPMRFVPMDSVNRNHVASRWHWRQLRGIQCILKATRGLISPNPPFFARAFGENFAEFLEILAMPDHYIMYREHYEAYEAKAYRRRYRRLAPTTRDELLHTLEEIHFMKTSDRLNFIAKLKVPFRWFAEQHYPDGIIPRERPEPRS